MNIRGRINRLEAVVAKRPRGCPVCGYPQRGVIRVIQTTHSDPLPTCRACLRPLDDHGRPLQTPYKRIILERPELV